MYYLGYPTYIYMYMYARTCSQHIHVAAVKTLHPVVSFTCHNHTDVCFVTSAAVAVRLGSDERFLKKLIDEWATNPDHAGVKGTTTGPRLVQLPSILQAV